MNSICDSVDNCENIHAIFILDDKESPPALLLYILAPEEIR